MRPAVATKTDECLLTLDAREVGSCHSDRYVIYKWQHLIASLTPGTGGLGAVAAMTDECFSQGCGVGYFFQLRLLTTDSTFNFFRLQLHIPIPAFQFFQLRLSTSTPDHTWRSLIEAPGLHQTQKIINPSKMLTFVKIMYSYGRNYPFFTTLELR